MLALTRFAQLRQGELRKAASRHRQTAVLSIRRRGTRRGEGRDGGTTNSIEESSYSVLSEADEEGLLSFERFPRPPTRPLPHLPLPLPLLDMLEEGGKENGAYGGNQ